MTRCVVTFVAGLAVLMVTIAALWARSDWKLTRPQPAATVPVMAPVLPIVSQRAVVDGKESIMLVRERRAMRIYVLYDGAIRGELMRLDLDTRTMVIPSRPPYGYSIGGR